MPPVQQLVRILSLLFLLPGTVAHQTGNVSTSDTLATGLSGLLAHGRRNRETPRLSNSKGYLNSGNDFRFAGADWRFNGPDSYIEANNG